MCTISLPCLLLQVPFVQAEMYFSKEMILIIYHQQLYASHPAYIIHCMINNLMIANGTHPVFTTPVWKLPTAYCWLHTSLHSLWQTCWDPEVHGNYLGQLEPHMLVCYWNEEYVLLVVNWITCSLLISQLQYYNMFYCASIHQPHTEWFH